MSLQDKVKRLQLMCSDWAVTYLGKAGIAGVVMLALAGALLAWGVYLYVNRPPLQALPVAIAKSEAPQLSPSSPTKPPLPSHRDAVDLLDSLARIAIANQIPWQQADYRYLSLSNEELATLSIRTTLKGSYVGIRKALHQMLATQPALALRELVITRASADTQDVEAKVLMVIYMDDGWVLPSGGKRD